jgi:transcriptional regulator with GAF, ATPase, and Fis domain
MERRTKYRADFLAWQREYVLAALVEAAGNQVRAASNLGIHRNSIGRMMGECGITKGVVKEALASRKV